MARKTASAPWILATLVLMTGGLVASVLLRQQPGPAVSPYPLGAVSPKSQPGTTAEAPAQPDPAAPTPLAPGTAGRPAQAQRPAQIAEKTSLPDAAAGVDVAANPRGSQGSLGHTEGVRARVRYLSDEMEAHPTLDGAEERSPLNPKRWLERVQQQRAQEHTSDTPE